MQNNLAGLVIAMLFSHVNYGQIDSISSLAEIKKFQTELNTEYSDRSKSPLEPKDFKKFRGHAFFPINLKYRVKATLKLTESSAFFLMQTSNDQPRLYRKYADVVFSLEGQEFSIPAYQSKDLMSTKEYADYLFFPFTDITNGETTYSAGRYIDLRIPKVGNELILDFNMAYNPYCAYSKNYSCPIVPRENDLNIKIEAGVKLVGNH
jgi:uncharacterized protein (DUF1684 family)